MDWRSIAFDWNRARAFLVTAEEGSLSAAAKALGTTQPTVGRQVTALEQELGVALFERFGRGLQLTPNGLELVDHARTMAEAANAFSLTASGQSQAIEGTIRITATQVAASLVLPPLLAELRHQEPGIAVELIASDALTDLRRREADIALRNVRPNDPTLYGRKLRDSEARLYAMPSYLAEIGDPETAEDLSAATFIGFENNGDYLEALNQRGLDLGPANFAVSSTSHLAHWEMVKQGIGIGVMPTRIGDAEPMVVQAAPWLKPFAYENWLVSHRELKTSRRVRLVFDWLAERL